MLFFSLAAALICAAAAGFVLWRAGRVEAAAAEPPEAAVYARQLVELDEQKAQGLLDEDGWRAARAEAGRRLLRAAKGAEAQVEADGGRDRKIVAAVAVATVVAGGLLYLVVGKPGQPDAPYRARLAQWEAAANKAPQSLDAARWAAVLEAARRAHPENPDAPAVLNMLGMAYAESGQFPQAEGVFEKLTRVRPQQAQPWAALGEIRLAEADGRVTPEARAAFEQALKLDPNATVALWWLGRDEVLSGQRDQGVALWRRAIDGLPAQAPLRAQIQAAIAQAESGQFGQAQAIAQAAPEQQAAMIRGMVEGLAKRLETGRGTPAEWARLVRAYTVLGESQKADAALARARKLFANDPGALKAVEAAAQPVQAGP
jgi:cytochrome c-type biogenesis protein CcmH